MNISNKKLNKIIKALNIDLYTVKKIRKLKNKLKQYEKSRMAIC